MVTSQCPTESEYQRAKTAITNMIENSQDLPRCVRLGKIIEFHKHDLGIWNISDCFQIFGMIYFIHFVAYHDCIGENGCDGCINLDDPNNNGLQGIVGRLENLKQNQGFSVGL